MNEFIFFPFGQEGPLKKISPSGEEKILRNIAPCVGDEDQVIC
jgi:hypothetical protein